MVRVLPKLILSLILGGLFIWLASRGSIPIIPSAAAFGQVSWPIVGAFVFFQIATHVVRATRCRFLIAPLKRLPLSEVIPLNWIGFFAIFALPLRLGEFARPILTKVRHGVSVSASLGTVAVERVVDGIIASLCVAWGLFALPRANTDDPLARHLPLYGYLSLFVFCSAFIVLAMFLWQRATAVRLIHGILDWFSSRLADKISRKVDSIAEGIRSLGDGTLLFGFVLESVIYWGLNAFGMWVLGIACGLPITFSHAVAVMGILAIGILLPAGPGMFGSFQLAVSTALKLYLPAVWLPVHGSVYIFLLYGIQGVIITLAGVIPLYVLHLSVSDMLRPPMMTEPPPA